MAYEKGATDFVNFMYRKYPEIDFINERSVSKDGSNFIELVFDLNKADYDELSLDTELIDKCVNFANRGNKLIVYCYDDEDWDELDESYKKEDFRADDGEYFQTTYLPDVMHDPKSVKQWALDWQKMITQYMGDDAGYDFYGDFMDYAEINKGMISDLLPAVKKSHKAIQEVENVLDAMGSGKSEADPKRLAKLADVLMDVRSDLEEAMLWDYE